MHSLRPAHGSTSNPIMIVFLELLRKTILITGYVNVEWLTGSDKKYPSTCKQYILYLYNKTVISFIKYILSFLSHIKH